MNTYMESQILNMVAMVKTFQASCKMAALKDDGTVDKAEERQLKKIQSASERFIRELSAIR